MKADYIIRAGEPLLLSLLAIEGDISNVISVEAKLKLAGPNNSVPSSSSPYLGTFIVTNVNAPDLGWNLLLNEITTENLKPGIYITNAKLNLVSGGPLKTDHILIEIKASVT